MAELPGQSPSPCYRPPWYARIGPGDDGDGRREVHCNSCEGAGEALRPYLRAFRGVHKRYLHLYVATYEAVINTKWVTPALIQEMCLDDLQ
jgi:hypothetical protein